MLSMDAKIEPLAWYAIHVTPQKEKQIAYVLSDKGYDCFLPLYARRRVWSDRIKVTEVPLFGGYVFCRLDVQFRLPVLMTPNVRAIVGSGKIPVEIPEPDLEAIRAVLRSGLPVEPCDSLHAGDAVRVTKGPLAGLAGEFVRYRGSCRLILSIPLINRSVAVEMDRVYVEPIFTVPRVEQAARLA